MFSAPRLIVAASALAIVAAVVAWIYRQGGGDVRQSIERQNNEAGRTADNVRSRFDLCPPWMRDFGAGECGRSPPVVGTDLIGARRDTGRSAEDRPDRRRHLRRGGGRKLSALDTGKGAECRRNIRF